MTPYWHGGFWVGRKRKKKELEKKGGQTSSHWRSDSRNYDADGKGGKRKNFNALSLSSEDGE